MINWSLFKEDIRQNFTIFLIVLGVLIMYLLVIINMYSPTDMQGFEQILKMKMSADVLKAFGFVLPEEMSLTKFISSYFYGLLIYMFPLIYTVVVANRVLAGLVGSGSMAFLLTSPSKRTTIAFTQGLFLLTSTWLLIIILMFSGMAFCSVTFPDMLDINAFFRLNIGACLLFTIITGIGFLASAIFNETKHSLMVGIGLPVLFLLLNMLVNVSEKLDVLRYFTILTLYDAEAIVNGVGYGTDFIIMGIGGIILYAIAIIAFNKRDLPV